MTEKEIRQFIKDNSISVPDGDKFMKDLVRQMDLLSTPASLASGRQEEIDENIRLVRVVYDAVKKHCRKQAVTVLVVDFIVCSLLFVAALFITAPQTAPASLQMLANWKYLIVSMLSVSILAFSLSRTDLFRL
ncbi:MAG: hypothetical protein ACI3ZL_02325 [Candidatus Cryptobacteroides sp.]